LPVAEALRGTARAEAPFPGLILREKEPLNLEFQFPTLETRVTPVNQFFVRTHFPIPKMDEKSWRLKINGAVNKEIELSYDDLRRLPSKTLAATIECSGNGRAYLLPKAKGIFWELGAVGNAEWTGVPLATVLALAGVKNGAVEVVLEGADHGAITEEPKSPGDIHFERSLPIAKARSPEVILAYQMNGEDLTPEHGFPVRAIVLGWFGMASVKWLTKLTLTAAPFRGFWQSLEYSYFERSDGSPTLIPVTEMLVKASIARPMLHEVVPGDKDYRVFGAAWAGEQEVAAVEISTDGGSMWQRGQLLGDAVPYAWRLWEYSWRTPAMGTCRLACRAIDGNGKTQSATRDEDRRDYLINHVVTVEVNVR
jgi:DMSO/TMAO reductase YedYZ molybdopterin-dependent catalytic subunit